MTKPIACACLVALLAPVAAAEERGSLEPVAVEEVPPEELGEATARMSVVTGDVGAGTFVAPRVELFAGILERMSVEVELSSLVAIGRAAEKKVTPAVGAKLLLFGGDAFAIVAGGELEAEEAALSIGASASSSGVTTQAAVGVGAGRDGLEEVSWSGAAGASVRGDLWLAFEALGDRAGVRAGPSIRVPLDGASLGAAILVDKKRVVTVIVGVQRGF